MKFHEDEHEVHHNSEQSGSSWHTQTSHGMLNQSGALGYNFNSSDITDPLRDTVTSLGWGWKTSLFKL